MENRGSAGSGSEILNAPDVKSEWRSLDYTFAMQKGEARLATAIDTVAREQMPKDSFPR